MTPANRLAEYWAAMPASYRRAGARWYPLARAEARALAARYGVSEPRAAAVIAALSPRNQWARNLHAAETVLAAAAHGRPCPRAGLPVMVAKAWSLATGATRRLVAPSGVRGPKVEAFLRAILGDRDAVTVDVWAARAAYGHGDPPPLTPAEYDRVAASYREAAAIVGTDPRTLQAAVWMWVRGVKPSDPETLKARIA